MMVDGRPLPGGEVEHDEDGGAEEDEGDAEAAEVARDGEVDHLLDGVEVGVVEVAEEPEDAGAEDLAQEDDEGGEVEDVDHADEPVDEDGGHGRGVVAGLAVLEGCVEEGQRADVQPPAADHGEGHDLDHQQEGHLRDGGRMGLMGGDQLSCHQE